MQTEIIVALIGAAGAALGSLVGIFANSRLTTYRLQKLEEKVAEHNKIVDRTYKLEEKAEIFSEKIYAVNHRIDDLEKGVK